MSIKASTSKGLAHAAPKSRRVTAVLATVNNVSPRNDQAGAIFNANTTIAYSQLSKKPPSRSNQHQAALKEVFPTPARLKATLTVSMIPKPVAISSATVRQLV